MATIVDPNRPNRIVLTVLALLGAFLCLVGWIRWLA